SRFRWYGPTLVLLVTTLAVLFATPALIRTVSWASTDATVQTIRNDLATNASLTDLSDAFKQVAQAVEPSVVHIEIESRQRAFRNPQSRGQVPPGFGDMFERFFGEDPRFRDDAEQERNEPGDDDFSEFNEFRAVANGSGWVYRHEARGEHAGNYIVTNAHVVENVSRGDRIKVTFADEHTAYAEIVGTDESTDVAVLQLDETEATYLHPALVGERPVEQGEIVFAFGSPFGAAYSFSMSQGIVSAVGRRVGIIGRGGFGGYENFIQTDAAINPGNSGGPLVNTRGQVVGMNTAIASRTGTNSGIGFAIPVDLAASIADRLISDGTVRRGFLGVGINDLDPDLAETFGFEGTDGVLIENIMPGGAAADSDLRAGDIVVAVDGEPITNMRELRFMIADLPPGQEVMLLVFRDGEEVDVPITLGDRNQTLAIGGAMPNRGGDTLGETDMPGEERLLKFGITGAETFTEALARRMRAEAEVGVLVTDVRLGSIARNRRLNGPNNGVFALVTQVGSDNVASVADLIEAVNEQPSDAPIRFTVKTWDPRERGYSQRFVVLALD
ncbi:MAG: trypsin-like peptidase domain-containing protein, partial [Planctomycetota bacterium]